MVTRGAEEELGIEVGSAVVAVIKAGAVHLVPRSL
jgi:molybdopterin-binding protein